MARPTARVLSLLELLQSGGVRTVAELACRSAWMSAPCGGTWTT